ncbi:hypothetical protein [Aquabacterium sp.]|uniref:hypothetical protein n=1 Tax=Aquabacterium sp. TaxID=1872578 RepID=UPI0019A77211|nr:hypothetical protein [Aquabacterium sp.]MBC7700523.1 hypothetical protein [Aquabacterium sp.]
MDQITHLVEQHIRASQSHLRHIDELMQRAATLRTTQTIPHEAEARFAKFQTDRAQFAGELDAIRAQSKSDAAAASKRGEGLTGILETIGLELEKALTAIFEQDGHADRT